MELYVDIADIESVKKVAEYYPIDGFTTNPKILTRAKSDIALLMPKYRAYTESNDMKIFVQVTADKAEDMLAQAKKLKDYFGRHLVIKIPAVKEGFKAVRLCKEESMDVCVTVIHSMTQALIAAKAGADYVAPYISHIDNIGADGISAVKEMIAAFENGSYPCKVLGASFRTADQIRRLAVAGCHAVTITPEMFDLLIEHPSTNESMAGFKKAWTDKFGKTNISDFI